MANFPYDKADQGALLTTQAILGGVATSTSDGYGAFRVSTIFAGTVTATTSPLSADSSRVSVVQGDAGLAHVSAFQTDAGNLMVSGKSGDAALFRVSAIGGTAGDRTLVDGTTQTISATLTPISTAPAETVAGLVTNTFQDDADEFHASAFSLDAGTFHVSAFGTFLSANQQISAVLLGGTANIGDVSALSPDAGLFRTSAILAAGVSSVGAASFGVSAAQIDAGVLHTSAFVDSGSISAKSGDANQVHVSAVQGDSGLLHVSAILAAGVSSTGAAGFGVSAAQIDAGALHVSAFASTATNLPVSATQADASLLRTSSFQSVVTTNTGGASIFFTSSGATSQVSTAKSTAGRLYGYHVGNPAGVDQYLQIFNASGGATAGTDTPALTLYVPTLGGAIMSPGVGIGFSNGIQLIGTSTANGQTIGASAMRINIFYA